MMNLISKMIFPALACGAFFLMVSCGGGSSDSSGTGTGKSVAKDAAKDYCECISTLSDKSGFEALACMLGLMEKYADLFDEELNFKNEKDEKAFLDAVKKCDPEIDKR